MKKDTSSIAKFFSELGVSRRYQRSGPKLSGVKNSENIAEHVFRAAQIAYVLAYLEEVDPEKTASMVLFHDNGELRVGDQNKVSARYFDISKTEKHAFDEQIYNLPESLAQRIGRLYSQFESRNTKEGIVARDADWLETAITAKEYLELGYKGQQNWIDNVRKALETKSAKELLRYIEKQKDFTNSWWQGLKKMTYRKLGNK